MVSDNLRKSEDNFRTKERILIRNGPEIIILLNVILKY
jgi:hypothetical protein